jgi:hypothetical protein
MHINPLYCIVTDFIWVLTLKDNISVRSDDGFDPDSLIEAAVVTIIFQHVMVHYVIHSILYYIISHQLTLMLL